MVKPVNQSGSAQPIDPIGKYELKKSGEATIKTSLPLTGGSPASRKTVLENAAEIRNQQTAKYVSILAKGVEDSNGKIPQGGSIISIGRVVQDDRALKYVQELFTDAAKSL